MNNRRRIIGITAAIAMAIIGTVALVSYVQKAKDDAVADETLVDVYIVDTLVPKGADPETIRSAVSVAQVPARLVQSGAITDLDEVGANVAASDLLPGDQLLKARLVAQEQVANDVVDKVQISTRLSAERAVGGTLKKGDLVGVYLSFEPFELGTAARGIDPTDATTDEESTETTVASDTPEKSPNMSRLEFQQVLVTNVQTTNAPVEVDTQNDGAAQVTDSEYVVTLALSPEQSERFVFAAEFGHVWLSIDPASVSDDGTRLVTLGNVYRVVK